jgi:methylmalonyl-CoA/ethylmalonyl-CoA epimerase
MPEDHPALPLVRDARIDHVAVAVRDVAAAAHLFRDVLGGEFLFGGDVSDQGFRFVQYRFPGGGKVELVTPIEDGFVSRFLDTRGEGIHHVTYRVRDIEAQVDRLRAAGVRLTLVNLENPHWKEAFLHPRDALGLLIQLAESPHDEDDTAQHMRERFPEAVLLGQAPGPAPTA